MLFIEIREPVYFKRSNLVTLNLLTPPPGAGQAFHARTLPTLPTLSTIFITIFNPFLLILIKVKSNFNKT